MTNTVLRTLALGERARQDHYPTRSMPLLGGPCPPLNNGDARTLKTPVQNLARSLALDAPGRESVTALPLLLLPRPAWFRSTFASGQVSAWPGSGEPAQCVWTRVKVRAEQCRAPAWRGIRRCLENNGEHHGRDPHPRTQHESDCQMSADPLLESGKRKLDVVEHHPIASGVGLLAHLSM
jgi:hypothetical protein